MSTITPIFPILDPLQLQDDQTNSFYQDLGDQIRKQHRRRTRPVNTAPPVKLSKPILRPEEFKKSKKKHWWQNALRFLKWSTTGRQDPYSGSPPLSRRVEPNNVPVYGGEFLTAMVPCRSSGPRSSPIAGTVLPKRRGRIEISYLSLRQLNSIDHENHERRVPNSSLPIYFVT